VLCLPFNKGLKNERKKTRAMKFFFQTFGTKKNSKEFIFVFKIKGFSAQQKIVLFPQF